MDTILIPNEGDFRRWVKESIHEYLELLPKQQSSNKEGEDILLTRKEIAGMFRISLVTLHDWMKRGLPSHKQRGRVYFLRSEVMAYLKQKGNKPLVEPAYPRYLTNIPNHSPKIDSDGTEKDI